jgi:hypothetical protein
MAHPFVEKPYCCDVHNPAAWCAAEHGDLLDRGGAGLSVCSTAGGSIAEIAAGEIGAACSPVLDAKSMATIHKNNKAMTPAATALNRSGEAAVLNGGEGVLSCSNAMSSPSAGSRPVDIPTPKRGLHPQ